VKRRRREQHGVDDAEDRRDSPDAERERENYDYRKARLLSNARMA
jgi:hypothetical protein